MSLYIKYRPTTFEQVKGNIEAVKSLTSMLTNKESCPHTFLLYGPTGCGKTTIARIIASSLNCGNADYHEVDSADFRGIDTVREIRKNCQFMPSQGDCRVYVIDECHKMTNDAQNAFLKILEDTPPHVYFILCTTEPQKLLATIKGRCSQFQVNPLSYNDLYSLLRKISRSEGEMLEEDIYKQIIETSLGHPRNAIQILEQVLSVPNEERLSIAKRNIDNQTQIIDLCRALMKRDTWSNIKSILKAIEDQDPEAIRRVVLGYCKNTLLGSENDRAAFIMEQFWETTYDMGYPYIVYACYCITKSK